jgi:hypothetical protein
MSCSNTLAFPPRSVFICLMKLGWTIATTMLLVGSAIAASKPHGVAFGKWTTIKWQPASDTSPEDLKIRPLLVDGKTKEFTVGPATM